MTGSLNATHVGTLFAVEILCLPIPEKLNRHVSITCRKSRYRCSMQIRNRAMLCLPSMHTSREGCGEGAWCMLPLLRLLRGHGSLLRALRDLFTVLDREEVLMPRSNPCNDFMLPLVA